MGDVNPHDGLFVKFLYKFITFLLNSLRNHDEDTHKKWEHFTDPRISVFSQVIYFVYHCQNYFKTEYGTQF